MIGKIAGYARYRKSMSAVLFPFTPGMKGGPLASVRKSAGYIRTWRNILAARNRIAAFGLW
jgi:hypothetical protein